MSYTDKEIREAIDAHERKNAQIWQDIHAMLAMHRRIWAEDAVRKIAAELGWDVCDEVFQQIVEQFLMRFELQGGAS